MKALLNPISIVIGAFLLLLVSMMLFTVDEREKAIKLRLGEVVETEYEAGLHFKFPAPFERVFKFDKRILTLDVLPEAVLTSEQKNVDVDYFIKWRIADAELFYTRIGGSNFRESKLRADDRLASTAKDGLKAAFGRQTLRDVISSKRASLMSEIQQTVDQEARGLGIEVTDVRIKKVELQPDVRESVYQRMEKEREKIAKEIRSEGEEQKKKIVAEADRIREETLAAAYSQAETTRGTGDAESARVYAEAYGTNPEFYNLFRSLQAYRKSFSGTGDVMVLEPKSDFFKFFNAAPQTTASSVPQSTSETDGSSQ
ncbi:MAG: protease modulator HflC [Gammaproteobacteria bacterium]|nr:protease modulator HflC [Gammaproteobacteria bacterium]